MDFHQLLAKMQQLDAPATEAVADECGGMPMPSAPMAPSAPPPSMSINVNAQGMDNIEDMLALVAKLNGADKPSMPPMPSMSPMPKIMSIKSLPDMDGDNDFKIGGEHDMDREKEEAWDNEPNEEEKDVDYMNNKLAGGLNRPKDTFPKVAGGDNPMQKVKEGSELRDQIRAELLRRLEEAKGAQ